MGSAEPYHQHASIHGSWNRPTCAGRELCWVDPPAIGVWVGGVLGDRLGRARPAAYLLVPTGLNLVWLGPVITAVQHLVAPAQRSTASACFLFVNNLIGLGLGIWCFGEISDALTSRYGVAALRYAIYSGLAFYPVSAGLLALAARGLKRDGVA